MGHINDNNKAEVAAKKVEGPEFSLGVNPNLKELLDKENIFQTVSFI